MAYCVNPECKVPENRDDAKTCDACGCELVLRGRYRAIRVLGQGGFGKTYQAIDEDRLGTECVIKQFMPQVQGAAALEKAAELFNQEAVRLCELGTHPQIPTLLAYFIHQDNQYLVQEFVPGLDILKELEKDGIFSEAKIWELLFDLLPILQFVHERQVIHRDLKPENLIRRQSDRRLVLIDFGGAKQMKTINSAITGTTIGSQGFIPMEILTEGQVFPSSDLYSLGVTCFNLLTQISPDRLFIKYGFSWIDKWRTALKTPISDALASIIGKFLKENLQERYQSASAALIDAQRLKHRLNQKLEASFKQPPKLPLPKITAVTSVVNLSGDLSVAKDELANQVNSEDDDLNELVRETFSISNSSPVNVPINLNTPQIQSQTLNEDDDLIQLIQEVTSGAVVRNFGTNSKEDDSMFLGQEVEIEELIKSLKTHAFVPVDADISIREWECKQVIEAHSSGVLYVGFSDNPQVLISAGNQSKVKSWNLASGELIKTLIDKEICGYCGGLGKAKNPAGSFRMLMSSQTVTCPKCEGFGTNPEKGEKFNSITVNAVTQTIVLSSVERGLKIFSDGGRLLQSLDCRSDVVAISPNGQVSASAEGDQSIKVWERYKLIDSLFGHQGKILALIFCDDNQTLISSGSDKTIKIWNIKTGKLLRTLVGHSKAVNALALSGDRKKLISGSNDTTIKVWDWRTGQIILDLRGHSCEISALATDKNSPLLISGAVDGAINVWDIKNGNLLCILVEHGAKVESLVFSGDGQNFVSGSSDRTIRIWEKLY